MKKYLPLALGLVPYLCFPLLLAYGMRRAYQTTGKFSSSLIYALLGLAAALPFAALAAVVSAPVVGTLGYDERGAAAAVVLCALLAACYLAAWTGYFAGKVLLRRLRRREDLGNL